MGMGEGKAFFGAILLIAACFGARAHSQEGINPLMHPGTRYARENIQSDVIAHWQGSVGVQFLGIGSSMVQQMALAEILSFGQASRIDLKINGFPNAMFDGNSLVNESRIVIFEYDEKMEASIKNGLGDDRKIGSSDFSNADESVSYILDQGLVEQTNGCFARWKASSANVIEASVIAVSRAISDKDKQTCLWNLIPPTFGISNIVSQYNAALALVAGSQREKIIFEDRSEMALQLSVAAACREDLGDLSYACSFRLINGIFAYHAELARLEVE